MFILVNPANFYSIVNDLESVALNACSISNDSQQCSVLLKKSLSSGGVSCHKDIHAFVASSCNNFDKPSCLGLVNGLNDAEAMMQYGSVADCLDSHFIQRSA